jgi:hypothetical protein
MKGDKSIFLGLSSISLIVLVFMAIFLWYLVAPRLAQIHPGLPLLVGFAMALFALAVTVGLFLILISTATEKNLLFPGENQLTVKVLFPISVAVGKLLGIPKDAVKRSFIQVNNALVHALKDKIDSRRVLLLLPHCLQNYTCIYKITSTMENCRRCGQCVVGGLAKLAEKHGVVVSMATGGTLARRVIVETKPTVIVGVACETDLTSGIQDAYPIPVLGILNERPQGPCRNCTVDLTRVEEALTFFLNSRPAPKAQEASSRKEAGTAPRHEEIDDDFPQASQYTKPPTLTVESAEGETVDV